MSLTGILVGIFTMMGVTYSMSIGTIEFTGVKRGCNIFTYLF